MTVPGLMPVADMIAAPPLPALAIGSDQRILALNTAAGRLLGMPAQGRHFITVLRQPSVVDVVEQCLMEGAQGTATYLTRDSGNEVTYSVHVDRLGDSAAVLVTFQDLTMVTAASRMRRDFVANVSHELRTPLTALMGFIETLRGPARDDAAARERFLATMQAETERMNRLVGDLLSLSRVEAQERERPTTRIDLAAVLSSVLRNLEPLAADADVVLVPDISQASVMVTADSDQMMQVFTNLVENAVKYSGDGGKVYISLEEHPRLEALRAGGIAVRVRDEGRGIDVQHLPRLTERFYRADSHRNRSAGGTGLGLAIVKHILNRHRGRLRITSNPGQGSEFTVFSPIERGVQQGLFSSFVRAVS